MAVFGKSKKQLEVVEAKIDHLTELIESEEYQKLKKDSEELKKTKELLSHVRFHIKETKIIDNQETGLPSLVVVYELPRVTLNLDEDGNPNKDEFFYATNMLDMISLTDMAKFQEFLRNARTRIKRK